ncbi:MAG TPA: ABC-type transport auxiliary lipoprotein family protein [Rubrivivax sp.]|nr:ABC-type transport auxiliary lipoprotein family protein [Rubrivivax sp.]
MGRLEYDARRRTLLQLPLLGAAPALGLLAGCTLSTGARQDFHLLRDPAGSAAGSAGPHIDRVLLIASAALPGLYDSDRMVFSADGKSRSYFQFGYWSERPAQSLLVLTEARFAGAKRFREVALSTAGVRGDLLLSLRLDELYLDASSEPGQVRLIVTAELIDWPTRKLLARRSFVQAAAASPRDASGVAQAASQAVSVVLGALLDWTVASAAAPAA